MEVYYSGSGFSRGHICPSADRQYSKTANYQTFCYTNMQPQYMTFNAGPRVNGKQQYTSPWVRLENKLRDWAGLVENEVIYVDASMVVAYALDAPFFIYYFTIYHLVI